MFKRSAKGWLPMSTADARTGTLFDPQALQPGEQVLPELLTVGPSLRVVYWPTQDDTSDRPCLVRCEGGQRNVVTIRRLVTICGLSCADAASTSAAEPPDKKYCQSCLAGAGRGVLR